MKQRVTWTFMAVISAATVLFGILHLARMFAADYERGEIIGVSRLEGTTTGRGRFIQRADGATLLCRRITSPETEAVASGQTLRVVAETYGVIESLGGAPQLGDTLLVWTPEPTKPGETIIESILPEELLEVRWGVLTEGALTGRVGEMLLIKGDASLGSTMGGFLTSSIFPVFILIPALLGFPYGYMLSRERGIKSEGTGNLTMSPAAIGYAFVGPALNLAIWGVWSIGPGDSRVASHASLVSVMLPMLIMMIGHAGLICFGSATRAFGQSTGTPRTQL